MQGLFSNQILADKLAKLNSSQQSIETLSHWCIFHRRSARQVVDIWEREFFSCPREQRVPFLFLANDILQNSRRKGGEFVNEFWRVLSRALRDAMKNGDDASRSTVLRLVDIWEERKVFGSHPQGLRVELLGKDAPPSAKRNEGLLPEKLVAVYKAFSDKLTGEEVLMDKCIAAEMQMESLERDIDISAVSGQESGGIVLDELQHQEALLLDSIQHLEAAELARSSIVFQLKETLKEQEEKLERTRVRLQGAHSHVEQNRMMQQQIYDVLNGQVFHNPDQDALPNGSEDALVGIHEENHHHDRQQQFEHVSRVLTGTTPSIPGMCGRGEEAYVPTEVKGFDPLAAAEVAAKLASSASSAAMFSSVLSSLAGETMVVPPPPQPAVPAPPPAPESSQQQQQRDQEEEAQVDEEIEIGVEDDEPAEKRRKLDDGSLQSSPRLSLSPKSGDYDDEGKEDGVDEVGSSTTVNVGGDTSATAYHPSQVSMSSAAVAAAATTTTTQFLEASSVLLPPFSFASQGISFAPAAQQPSAATGCAPETYGERQPNPLSFFMPTSTQQ